jgi:hypothetical protein
MWLLLNCENWPDRLLFRQLLRHSSFARQYDPQAFKSDTSGAAVNIQGTVYTVRLKRTETNFTDNRVSGISGCHSVKITTVFTACILLGVCCGLLFQSHVLCRRVCSHAESDDSDDNNKSERSVRKLRHTKLTTHLQLLPRTRKRGSIPPLHHTSSWRSVFLDKHRDNFILLFMCRR